MADADASSFDYRVDNGATKNYLTFPDEFSDMGGGELAASASSAVRQSG
ncbi:MAG: hypothetical protein H7123_10140 [Thermoleophilia bacterium]|nr:hypothetical protein [Thermoleophilia bacterium]